jgi:hypothetical protein
MTLSAHFDHRRPSSSGSCHLIENYLPMSPPLRSCCAWWSSALIHLLSALGLWSAVVR